MFHLSTKFIFFVFLFVAGFSVADAQSPSPIPQSKEAKEAAEPDEKQRKQREKEAEIDRKTKQKEPERQAKYLETKPINRTSSYDRFKDLTTYSMDKMLVLGNNNYTPVIFGIANFWLTGGFYVQGQTWKKPEQIIFQFEVLEAYWEFRDSNNRTLIFLIDGERLNLGMMGQGEFNVQYVGNLEKLFVPVSYEVFVKIANAKTVEAQLGRLEFSLNPRHLQGLRNLIEPPAEKNKLETPPAKDAVESGEVPFVGNLVYSATYKISPSYPKEARKAKITGVVKVEVLIDEYGNVVSATGVSGEGMLIESAIEAAKQWKFNPTTVSGQSKPSKVRGTISFNFTL